MITIGGKLKRKESLSARLGDMLSFLYTGSAVLKYYELQDNKEAKPVAQWVCQDLLYRLQKALHEFLQNMPNRWLAAMLRMVVFPLGRRFDPPSDKLGKEVAALLLEPSSVRESLTKHAYKSLGQHGNPMGNIEEAFNKAIEVEPLFKVLRKAQKDKIISGMEFKDQIKSAVDASVLTEIEGRKLMEADQLRMKIINVDDFSQHEFNRTD